MAGLTDVHALRQALDAAGVGYAGSDVFVGLLAPEPFWVSVADWQHLETAGDTVASWLRGVHDLYVRSLRGDSNLAFVTNLVENEGRGSRAAEITRQVALSGRWRPPALVRLDQPVIGTSVEAQIPGSGWGYRSVLSRLQDPVGPDLLNELATTFQQLTGLSSPRVGYIQYRNATDYEDRWLEAALRRQGTDFTIYRQTVPPPDQVDLILRRYLVEWLEFPGAAAAVEAYLAGQLEIDPPPSLITDQKVGLTLPFNPSTAAYFSNAVRALWTETRMWQPGCLRQIMDQPARERQFVIKYAGFLEPQRACGRAVFNLTQMSRQSALALESRIAASGEPWIIQRLIQIRFPICAESSVDGAVALQKLYARFTPGYSITSSGNRLISCTANFRNVWKVASGSQSVITTVRPQGKESSDVATGIHHSGAGLLSGTGFA